MGADTEKGERDGFGKDRKPRRKRNERNYVAFPRRKRNERNYVPVAFPGCAIITDGDGLA